MVHYPMVHNTQYSMVILGEMVHYSMTNGTLAYGKLYTSPPNLLFYLLPERRGV